MIKQLLTETSNNETKRHQYNITLNKKIYFRNETASKKNILCYFCPFFSDLFIITQKAIKKWLVTRRIRHNKKNISSFALQKVVYGIFLP